MAPARDRIGAGPARAAVGLDRQRRLARPGSAVGRGAAAGRRRADPRRGRRRGRARAAPARPSMGTRAPNTTSVYTAAQIFPMLPERLSTDLTSLGEGEERLAIVMDLTIDCRTARSPRSDVYRATVLNRARSDLRRRRRVARRRGARAAGARRRARTRRADSNPGPRRAGDEAAPSPSTARSRSRASRRGRCSTATRSPTCARTRRTARRS